MENQGKPAGKCGEKRRKRGCLGGEDGKGC